ncbi:MAG: oligoribonuclease [Pseudomonadota bacterium]
MGQPDQVTSRWVWIDLEMTGLDVEQDVILQIATVITDSELNELASLEQVVWQPDEVLARMTPFVRDMHGKNGLRDRVRASATSLRVAERHTMELLCAHVPYGQGILAGASISTDRSFLRRYMTSIDGYLHYRHLDVTSLKIACSAWLGEAGMPPEVESPHTALEDIRQSIADLRFYRDLVLDRHTAPSKG